MKTDKGYRFTISFPGDTAERVRVGEFLESCGNKKSAFIVQALSEYLDANPELPESKVELVVRQTLTREDIESIVREAIRSSGGIVMKEPGDEQAPSDSNDGYNEKYVSKMVDNLTEFF